MRPARLATVIEQANAGCAVAVIEVAESDQGDRQEQENEMTDAPYSGTSVGHGCGRRRR